MRASISEKQLWSSALLAILLFPPSMHDWLPQHHLARFIVEIVEQLDLKPMEGAYGTSGSAPFHPAFLLSILVAPINNICPRQ